MELQELTIEKGQDIKTVILDYLVSHNMVNVVFLNAIGSAKDLVIAAPYENDLPLRAMEIPFHSSCEIIGFSGETMSWDAVDPMIKAVYPDKNAPLFLHLHVAAATAGGHVFGGGLRGGVAFRSIRIFFACLD